MDRYINGGIRHVQGWLNPISAKIIASLSKAQREAGFTGGVGEIGVHHGKLLILLHEGTTTNERTVAIDVFEDQHLNTDGSGRGDKAKFLENLKIWSDRPEAVDVIQASSLDLTPQDVLSKVGKLRLSSVDGGHTAQCAENDIRLFDSASHEYAVIVVDDVFNANWPDVVVGLARYCFDSATGFRPFAVSPNKVYLARTEHHDYYRKFLLQQWPQYYETDQAMFDQRVAIFGLEASRGTLKASAKTALKRLPIYPRLRELKRSLRS